MTDYDKDFRKLQHAVQSPVDANDLADALQACCSRGSFPGGQMIQDIVAALRSAAALAEHVCDCKCHQWSLIETAPKDGTEILGWWSGSRAHTIISWSSEGWWKDCADDSAVSPPTHWQSLTDGPTIPAPKGAK